jgi:regulator of protease activity HflC (stomatin/prohibitin superfamily)
MKREFLEGLGLDKETIDKVMAEHGKDVATVTGERDNYKAQAEQSEAQFKTLQANTKDNAELQQQLKDAQAERDQAKADGEAQIATLQKGNAIELALRDASARNTKAVRALLDEDKLEMKDGKLTGLDDQLTAIQKDNDYLFQPAANAKKPTITNPGNPDPKGGSAASDSIVQRIQARLEGAEA